MVWEWWETEDMSNQGILARIVSSTATVIRTPLWVTTVAALSALTMIATALTLFSDTATVPGLDAGRMALSFDTLLVLAFALFTIPAIVDRVRHSEGPTDFLGALITATLTGASLLIAAAPALVWAILSTGVDVIVWMSALGAVKIEILLVVALVAVAFSVFRTPSTATALAYASVTSLIILPLIVLGVFAALPGTTQVTYRTSIDWDKTDSTEIDPVTGYPIDPECTHTYAERNYKPRYDSVWFVAPVIPFITVSESVEPTIVEFVEELLYDQEAPVEADPFTTVAPVDIFSTIAFQSRSLQLVPAPSITINECELLAEHGDPYWDSSNRTQFETVLSSTQSGFVPGLIGQGVIVGAWVAGMLVIPRIRRKR